MIPLPQQNGVDETGSPNTSSSRCLYCGCPELVEWFEGVKDRFGHVPGEWRFLRCLDCGSALLDPFPAVAEIPSFYPPTYCFALPDANDPPLSRLRKEIEYRFFFRRQYEQQARIVLRLLDRPAEGLRLLDVGCGTGLRLKAFHRRGVEVQGTDLDAGAVQFVRDSLALPVEELDATEIAAKFGPDSFEVVTAFSVLEHLPVVDDFLERCLEVLRPGGTLVAAVPLVDSLQTKLLGARWPSITEAPRHLSLPSTTGIWRALEKVGFEKIRILPDATFASAAQYGMALFPGGTTTHAASQGRFGPLVSRLLGAAVTATALPLAFFENRILKRPGLGIVVGQKTLNDASR